MGLVRTLRSAILYGFRIFLDIPVALDEHYCA
jgi:hypothetical protein